MKTRIAEKNPFRRAFHLDHAFAWETISTLTKAREGSVGVLDYGAHDGKMLLTCLHSGLALEAYGVDANKSAIERGSSQIPPGYPLRLGNVGDVEGFAVVRGGFDVVCLMGVIEHVLDQPALLSRLRSALRPGGTLILSAPGRHFLSWLDFGNWKFYFPTFHELFIKKTKGEDYYRVKFVECQNGLFGDIEVGKNEHQHFRASELIALIEGNGFKVERVDGYGFFYRLLHNIWWLSPPFLKTLLNPVIRVDLRMGSRAELVISARRV
jgi:SAM-dependent methyltransferase